MSRRAIHVSTLTDPVRAELKQSFSCRRVPREAMLTVVAGAVRPRSGDVVLARVVRLGAHRRLETTQGRRATLHLGDEIIVAYGDRYATDQFESHVPYTLGRTHLVASGGIASQMQERTAGMRMPSEVVPVGLVGDAAGRPLNLADFALPEPDRSRPRPPTIAVLGTSMNSGKTTTIHWLVHTLAQLGARPGATKVTGTGSGNDYWVMMDAGAHRMLDFGDVGLASTYRQPMPVLERALIDLTAHLSASGTGFNFVEIADGVYQQETMRLIDCDAFRETIDAVIFAAGDAMGAVAGVRHLTELGHKVLAVAGKLTASPLASREARAATGLPVLGLTELADADLVAELLHLDRSGLTSRPTPLQPAWPEAEVDPSSRQVIDLRVDDEEIRPFDHAGATELFWPSAELGQAR